MPTSHTPAPCACVWIVLSFGVMLTGCHRRSSSAASPRASAQQASVVYGTPSKLHLAESAQSVTGDELRKEKVGRTEELFVGRFPGVRVLRTVSGELLISIRGSGLWSTREQPLYVVDGIAVVLTPGRGLDWLVPEDIERIDVLKGAAETSMYGGRGANGVVRITTKQPR